MAKLFYKRINKDNIMGKRGQFPEVLGMLVVVGIVIFGTAGVFVFHKEEVFVGDKANYNLYKYADCKEIISLLDQDNLVVFDSLNKAKSEGYGLVECK